MIVFWTWSAIVLGSVIAGAAAWYGVGRLRRAAQRVDRILAEEGVQ